MTKRTDWPAQTSRRHAFGAMLVALLLVSLVGVGHVSARVRITGGVEADIKDFPHQISLERNDGWSSWALICGGSVLTPRFILSAAHCVKDNPQAKLYQIRAGSSQREKGGDTYAVQRLWFHPFYTKRSKDYDVSVLLLESSILFSESVRPVQLASWDRQPKLGESLVVSGWGLEDYGDYDIPNFLRAVEVVVTDSALCDMEYSEKISKRMVCAASPGKDSCSGDSGGPILNEFGEQVGIVSFGLNCALPGYPGVFTNTANEEIQDYIKEKLSIL